MIWRVLLFELALFCYGIQAQTPNISYIGCGTAKGCLFEPPNCDKTAGLCDRFLSYKYVDSEGWIQFELAAKSKEANQDFYAALGFSYDNDMGNDSVTACVYSKSGGTKMLLAFNPGGHNAPEMIAGNYENKVLTSVNTAMIDGTLQCTFNQKIAVDADVDAAAKRIFNLDANYYLFAARGPYNATSSSPIGFHFEVPARTDTSVYMKGKPDSTKFISKNGCGYAKGCLATPNGCEPGFDCTKVVTYSVVNNDTVRFEISAKRPTSASTDFYAAVGFSVDGKMANASVTACTYPGTTTSIANVSMWHIPSPGHIPPQQVTFASNEISLIQLEESAVINDILICRFTQKIRIPDEDANKRSSIWPLNAPYRVLLARGNYSTENQQIRHHQEPPLQSEAIDVTGPLSDVAKSISMVGCGDSKACFPTTKTACSKLDDDCRQLTFTSDGTWVTFEVSGRVPNEPQHYMELSMYLAVGFSNDTRMPDTAFTFCSYSNSAKGKVQFGHIPPSAEFAMPIVHTVPPDGYLKLLDAGVVDGVFVCRFQQKIDAMPSLPNGQVISLKDAHRIFLLRGSIIDGFTRKHIELPLVSDNFMNLTNYKNPIVPTPAEKCGDGKGCVRYPANCNPTSDCTYALTWTPVDPKFPNYITFEMAVQAPSAPAAGLASYIALGFSHDKLMGDDAVTLCYYQADTKVGSNELFYNPQSHNPSQLVDAPANLNLITTDSVSIANNIMVCKFKQKITPPTDLTSKVFPLNANKYYLVFARGSYDVQGKKLQQHNGIPFVSDQMVNVSSVVVVEVNASGDNSLAVNFALKKTHGIMMIIGWWIFIVNGILIARYFKSVINHEIGGTKLWFILHRVGNSLGLLCIIVAFICIFVAKKGEWSGKGQKLSDPVGTVTHAVLGMTAVVSGLLNPIMALFRCHPGTDKRPIFNLAHRIVGILAWVCASAAIFEVSKEPFPFDLSESGRYQNTPRILMYVYFVALGLAILVLEELFGSFEGKTSVSSLFTKQPSPEPPAAGALLATKSTTKFWYLRVVALLVFNIVGVSVAVIEAAIVGLSILP